jgi:hypothetical protein
MIIIIKLKHRLAQRMFLKSKGGRILLSIGLVVMIVIGIIIWRIWRA